MISREAVAEFFGALAMIGVSPPAPWRTGDPRDQRAATDLAIQVWQDALADVQPLEFSRGCRAYLHTASSGYWPMPAQIRALIVETSERRALTSDEAIGSLLVLARRIGGYRPQPEIEGSDATRYGIAAVLSSVGGWSAFCASTVDAAFLARCRRTYEAAVAEEDRHAAVARLDAARPAQIEARRRLEAR